MNSPGLSSDLARKPGVFDNDFLRQFLYLFESPYEKETDLLKHGLHRIYAKLFYSRRFIKDQIASIFNLIADEGKYCPGVREILIVLGTVVNGFGTPLKKEHQTYLRKFILPLHRSKLYYKFQEEYIKILLEHISKDMQQALPILNSIIHYWPWSSPTKQVLFLDDLEKVLTRIHPLTGPSRLMFMKISHRFYSLMALLISSPHFQLAEKALNMWGEDIFNSQGCLSGDFAHLALPILYQSLKQNSNPSTPHWQPKVAEISQYVIDMYRRQLTDHNYRKIIKSATDLTGPKGMQDADSRKVIWDEICALADSVS